MRYAPPCRGTATLPLAEEVSAFVSLAGAEGGCNAVIVDEATEVQAYIDATPPLDARTLTHERMAARDFKETVWKLKQASKRKAAPAWSCPVELWLLVLAPEYYSVGERMMTGVGAEGAKSIAKLTAAKMEM